MRSIYLFALILTFIATGCKGGGGGAPSPAPTVPTISHTRPAEITVCVEDEVSSTLSPSEAADFLAKLVQTVSTVQQQCSQDLTPLWGVTVHIQIAGYIGVPGQYPLFLQHGVGSEHQNGTATVRVDSLQSTDGSVSGAGIDWPIAFSEEVLEMAVDPYPGHMLGIVPEICDPMVTPVYGGQKLNCYKIGENLVRDFISPEGRSVCLIKNYPVILVP